MPNWCDCTLEITGDPNLVQECLAAIRTPGSESDDEQPFDFDRVIPLPPEFRARLETPCVTETEWAARWLKMVELWGTKWNAHDVTVEIQPDGGGARVQFSTAWSPPEPIIMALADRFPSLEFDFVYLDVQMPIAGRARRVPGEGWATIEARYDDGFCQAAVEARSGRWDQKGEAPPRWPGVRQQARWERSLRDQLTRPAPDGCCSPPNVPLLDVQPEVPVRSGSALLQPQRADRCVHRVRVEHRLDPVEELVGHVGDVPLVLARH
jgi:hypothetical protein